MPGCCLVHETDRVNCYICIIVFYLKVRYDLNYVESTILQAANQVIVGCRAHIAMAGQFVSLSVVVFIVVNYLQML